jgi:hypothetical protein
LILVYTCYAYRMFIVHFWWWLQHVTGSDNVSGRAYGFFSGFGSDLTEIAIIGSLIGLYRHHNCAVKGCPRIAHHGVDGTHFKTCHKHATLTLHRQLQADHARKFPKQHELFKKKGK